MSVVIFFLVFSLVSLIVSIVQVQVGKYYESFYNLLFCCFFFLIVCGVKQLNNNYKNNI